MEEAAARAVLAEGIQAYLAENYADALAALRRAAEQDIGDAHYYLALMYRDGNGVARDQVRSAQCVAALHALADNGNAEAQFRVGKMAQYGDLLPASNGEAVRYLNLAAGQNHTGAQFHLSCAYSYGWCDLMPDPHRAKLLLAKAVAGGNAEAMYAHYLETDEREYLVRAAQAGFLPARRLLRRMTR